MEKNVFGDENEIERLYVQNMLLSSYEAPMFQSLFEGKKGLKVLDIGCNDGNKTVQTFRHNAVERVVGLEYNEAEVKKARSVYGSERYSFHCCDVESDGFEDELKTIMAENGIKSFDIIYMSFVLMHLSSPEGLLRTVMPFLSDDGSLVITEADDSSSELTPDSEGLLKDFLAILKKDIYSGNRQLGGVLCNMLTECGWSDIRVWCDGIGTDRGGAEQRSFMFRTFFSYLPEDVKLLCEQYPNSEEYRQWSEWLDSNYSRLRKLIESHDSQLTMGMKILTCGKGKK